MEGHDAEVDGGGLSIPGAISSGTPATPEVKRASCSARVGRAALQGKTDRPHDLCLLVALFCSGKISRIDGVARQEAVQ